MIMRFLLCLLFATGSALAQAPRPITPEPAPRSRRRSRSRRNRRPAEAEIAALILAGEEGTLSSQMAGRISSIKVGLGDGFKKGSALIEFDCSEQRAQLQAADAEYRGARETTWRGCACRRSGAAGELDVTLAAAAAERARSQVDFRRAQMALLPGEGAVRRQRRAAARQAVRKRAAGQPLIDWSTPTSSRRRSSCRRPGRLAAPGRAAHHPRQGDRPELRARVAKLQFAHRRRQPAARSRSAHRQGRRQPAAGMVGAAVFPAAQALAPK
jgi:hypothetical protein